MGPGATHAGTLRVYPSGEALVKGPCRAADPSSIRTPIRWLLGCVGVVLVVSMILEWRQSSALVGDMGPGSIFAAYTSLGDKETDTPGPARKAKRVLTANALPAFMYQGTQVPGLSLFGAYWKGEGDKVVFSGQCFDQHHAPDYCALYLQSNTSLCTVEGTIRQVAGGVVECFLDDPLYDCPLATQGSEASGVMAVVGRRDEQTAHTIALSDYRTWAVSGGSKHHLSVCTIFKAQASDPQLGVQRFLEWLAYHETVGVQHFYLYDHQSDHDKIEALRPLFASYEAQGKLTLRHVDFSNKCGIGDTGMESSHEWVYADCSARYSGLDTWMAFLDNDEYIYPGDEYGTVSGFLQGEIEGPGHENVVAVNMVWTPFGSSGHDRRPEGTVIDNYIKAEAPRCYTGENVWDVYCTGKMLGRLDRMGYLSFPHLVDYDSSHGLYGVDTKPEWWANPEASMASDTERDRLLFNRPEPSNAYCLSTATITQGTLASPNASPLCIWTPDPSTGLSAFHYYTQSVQDWQEKMDRGCVVGCQYTWDQMYDHDNKAHRDETRLRDRFGERVRVAMASVNLALQDTTAF